MSHVPYPPQPQNAPPTVWDWAALALYLFQILGWVLIGLALRLKRWKYYRSAK